NRIATAHPDIGGLEVGRPNPTEAFLHLIRRQLFARAVREEAGWGVVECDVFPLGPGLAEVAERLARGLARIAEPIATLRERLLGGLDEEADELDSPTRNRIEAAGRSLSRRVLMPLAAWQEMLRALTEPQRDPGERPYQVMFLRLARAEGGREIDVGLHR